MESVRILVILNPAGYMLTSFDFDAFHSLEVYSIDSSKTIGNSPAEVSNLNAYSHTQVVYL